MEHLTRQMTPPLATSRRSDAGVARTLLDAFPVGVIVVDGRCGVLDSNDAAERLLRARDGIQSDGEVLHASQADATRHLQSAVRWAASSRLGAMVRELTLARPSGARPLQLLVVPLSRDASASDLQPRPVAALFVSDPELQPSLSELRVQRLLGLTHAEARVATQLAIGANPEEIAERIGVRPNTVRYHLKQIYAKTGTHRQAELVRLLLTGPSILELR